MLAPYGYQLLDSASAIASYNALDTLWLIVAAALVFFMQAGFAMVESGFTRAKNAGNIIMKNTLDMAFATIAFIAIGCSFAYGTDLAGLGIIGVPDLFLSHTDLSNGYTSGAYILFQLVFAGAAATIVSGGMAERTKFGSYCIYSIIMCAFVYPVVCHWVWSGNGWLYNMGYIDFAGSTVVHMIGGITALLGAFFLGPRIGKYDKDGKAHAFPGHNLTIAALGVFILWFGWFGFNGGSSLGISSFELGTLTGEVLLITCLAAAAGTVSSMLYSRFKFGYPDVSFTLNGCLAGMVAICAGASAVDYYGAIIIGAIAGITVVVVAEFIDKRVKIDDPVGAFAVHGACGAVGTILVGFLANPDCYAGVAGVLYGGSLSTLGIQCFGVGIIALWTIITMGTVFYVIKHTIGLRVSAEEEISGLDISEHGLASAYSGIMPDLHIIHDESELGMSVQSMAAGAQAMSGMTVTDFSAPSAEGLKKVVVITRRTMVGALKASLDKVGVTGMTVTYVAGYGAQKGHASLYRGIEVDSTLLPKVKAEVVLPAKKVNEVVAAIKSAVYTGAVGDGKIFIYSVDNAVRVRTGEAGDAAVSNESA
ncbi:MAG: ammonium transporter [Candidatus Methanomethylophilus sp.]|nr:ammonium transporter [Methanomethylophilus sp.]MDD4222097.1 ammonium transporter [Methanomethylophilus sp.]MDD4668930.1 ammonium transporter [Methanomethylophilus sp.]